MTRDKLLSDFVGRNDKTKIVAKLQKPGAGAPTREPIVDEKTQKVTFLLLKQRVIQLARDHFLGDDGILLQEARRSQETRS